MECIPSCIILASLKTGVMSGAMAMMSRMTRAWRVFDCHDRMDRGTGGLRRARPEITGNHQGQNRQAQGAQQPGNDQSAFAS